MTSTLISSNLSSSFFPTENLSRIRIPATLTSGGCNIRTRRSKIIASSHHLPLLPFSMSEVLVPTESKTLHLYEARYLALLEESMKRKKNMFVHFVLDPISISETATEASFAARYGCLVLIENVERLDIGALVSIRGAGRVKISRFLGADPYLSGEVRPIQVRVNHERSNEITSKITQLKDSIKNLNSLEIKLKAPEDSPLQTRLFNSLNWAEDEPPVECDESFFPSLQERLSFAAFQPVSGFSGFIVRKIDKVRTIKITTREIKGNGYERYNREVRTLNRTHQGEHFLYCCQTRDSVLGYSLDYTISLTVNCKISQV